MTVDEVRRLHCLLLERRDLVQAFCDPAEPTDSLGKSCDFAALRTHLRAHGEMVVRKVDRSKKDSIRKSGLCPHTEEEKTQVSSAGPSVAVVREI